MPPNVGDRAMILSLISFFTTSESPDSDIYTSARHSRSTASARDDVIAMISAAQMLFLSAIHFSAKTCMLLILSMTLTPTCTVRFFAGMSIGTKLSAVLSAPPKITGKSPSLTSRIDLNSGLAGAPCEDASEGLKMLRMELLRGSFPFAGKV